MKIKILLLSVILISIFSNSCYNECGGVWRDQLYRFGEYELRIDSSSDTLQVGDSIRFSISMHNHLYDSISLSKVEIESIEIGFYVTRDVNETFDTSLINIFDQYFDIIVNKGEMINPKFFSLEEIDTLFELDFYYICKKELKYSIPIRFNKIIAKNVDTKCMEGNTENWGAYISIDSDYNLYGSNQELINWFGFIVQE